MEDRTHKNQTLLKITTWKIPFFYRVFLTDNYSINIQSVKVENNIIKQWKTTIRQHFVIFTEKLTTNTYKVYVLHFLF